MKFGLIVDRKQCQKIRKLLEENNLVDTSFNVKDIGNNKIALPLKVSDSENKQGYEHAIDDILSERGIVCGDCADAKNLKNPWQLQKSGFVVDKIDFVAKKPIPATPFQNLKNGLTRLLNNCDIGMTKTLEREIPDSWEKHGDLVLVPPNSFTSDVWRGLGDSLWKEVCKCLSANRVARKDRICSDGFRTPQVSLLYGESGWVEHTDNGIKYSYDITKNMFSSGNVTEKLRVAKFDCSREVVVDLYAGIGYFTLPYLVHARAQHVHACEWNPNAVEALRKNLKLNGVEDRCSVYQGDNREVCPKGVANRVNLGLIPSSEEGWSVACTALKPSGGILHVHSNIETRTSHSENNSNNYLNDHVTNSGSCDQDSKRSCDQDSKRSCDQDSKKAFKKKQWNSYAEDVSQKMCNLLCQCHTVTPWTVSVLHIEHVKSYAPHVDHVVIDLLCCPT